MALNADHLAADLFGVPLSYSTGAAGAVPPADASFPTIGTVPVSSVNTSAQAGFPSVSVDADDTAGQIVPQTELFSGVAGVNTTGAGLGSVHAPRGARS